MSNILIEICKYPPDDISKEDIIYLSKDNWDDFGWKTNYYIWLDHDGIRYTLGNVKISSFNNTDILEFIKHNRKLPDDAFSLGQSSDYYHIIDKFSNAFENFFFEAMHDVAFNKTLLNLAMKEDSFIDSLIRFVNVYQIQNLLSHSFDDNYVFGFRYLYNDDFYVDNEHFLEFECCFQENANSMFAFVGYNGCGKTTLLKTIVTSIYNDRKRIIMTNNEKIFSVISIGYTSFDDWTSLNSQIYSINKNNKNKNFPEYFSFSFGGDTSNGKIKINLRLIYDSPELCENFIQVVQFLTTDPFFDIKIYDACLKYFEANKELFQNEPTNLIEKILRLYQESSAGQKFIFVTLLQLCARLTFNSIIFLDEPENHLQPPLLALYINVISLIARKQKSIVIFATHSPIVLQEINSNNIYIMSRNEDALFFKHPSFQTYGSGYQVIVDELFRLEVEKTGFYKVLSDYVDKDLTYEQILQKFNGGLGSYGKSILMVLLNNKNEKN